MNYFNDNPLTWSPDGLIQTTQLCAQLCFSAGRIGNGVLLSSSPQGGSTKSEIGAKLFILPIQLTGSGPENMFHIDDSSNAANRFNAIKQCLHLSVFHSLQFESLQGLHVVLCNSCLQSQSSIESFKIRLKIVEIILKTRLHRLSPQGRHNVEMMP